MIDKERQELMRLRTDHWKKFVPLRDLPDAALNKAWGEDGSWQVTGELPRNILGMSRETPFNERRFRLCPKAAETGKKLLERSQVACVNIKGCKDVDDTKVGQDNF